MGADREWLFSYGTLKDSVVQEAVFGRQIEMVEDLLVGFRLESVQITDPHVIAQSGSDVHPILRRGAAFETVAGAALFLDQADLAAADRYEVDDYVRTRVRLASGRRAYAYVSRGDAAEARSILPSLCGPDIDLLERLLPVARNIFTDTFARGYDPDQFEKFCDEVYLPGGSMSADFATPDVHWQVATVDGDPIGYAKLTPLRVAFDDAAPGAMEMQQLYVAREWQGTGVADRLAEWSLATAREGGASEIYLTVFDHNERAKRFYARYGFSEVGRCTFRLGDRVDDDRIWRARL